MSSMSLPAMRIELEDEFIRLDPEPICAFIAESVVDEALGRVLAVLEHFKAAKAVRDKHGALLILDEVMAGVGRIGALRA
ncbi:MAG: hypothetical protein M1834_003533 [Cirrosporium novae-zelandiae]|nr:MAG: hypothetical protein M1834_003533 [Cirrosporium novae-zelandiae]